MKGGKKPLGYTVVEVLIVLAVSGLLFGIAANFISGKQESTSFTQGSNEFASRIQGVINDINDGQYSDIPFTCKNKPAGLEFDGNVVPPGKKQECVFLGKLMHFSISSKPTKYEIFTLAGAREKSAGVPATNLIDAKVGAVYQVTTDPKIDLTRRYTTPQNINVIHMEITDDSGAVQSDAYTLGFLQDFGAGPSGGSTIVSGATTIKLIYAGPTIKSDKSDADVATSVHNSSVLFARSACMIISDGTRTAKINVGENNDLLGVKITQLGKVSSGTC